MPELTQSQQNTLTDELAELYQTSPEIQTKLRETGVSLGRINLQGSAVVIWSGAIAETIKQQAILALVEAAFKDYPKSQVLQASLQALESNVSTSSATPTVDIHNLTLSQRLTLIKLLSDLPSLRSESSRLSVIDNLPREVSNRIIQFQQFTAQERVAAILNASLESEDGFSSLMEVLRFFDGGTIALNALDKFISDNAVRVPIQPLGSTVKTVSDQEIDRQLEELTGLTSTLLPISWLDLAQLRSKAVARIVRADGGMGTGFLISGNYFLTNHHVFHDNQEAKASKVQFNYQKNADDLDLQIVEFKPDGEFFRTSVENDWSIVKLQGDTSAFGTVPLKAVTVQKNDRANIIQHPAGGPKQIAFYHNLVTHSDSKIVRYLTDTLGGSSGSPVFNDRWELIALHREANILTDNTNKKVVYENAGTSIVVLLEDFKQLGLNF